MDPAGVEAGMSATATWRYKVWLIPAAGRVKRLAETHPDVETALVVGEWRAAEWFPGQEVEVVVVDRRTGEAGICRRTGGERV